MSKLTVTRWSFNQDGDCICAIHGSRLAVFYIANDGTPRLKTHADLHTEIFSAVMLHKTNLIAVIGGHRRRRVRIYDDRKTRVIFDIDTEFPIARLALRRNALLILTIEELAIHSLTCSNLAQNALLPCIMKIPSHHATILAISYTLDRFLVATDTQQRGYIRLIDLTTSLNDYQLSNNQASSLPFDIESPPNLILPSSATIMFRAHDGCIRALALSQDGSLLATASDRGTLLRIWKTRPGSGAHMIAELRRGTDSAYIFSLAFSHDNAHLVVTSDKGTIHIFHVPIENSTSNTCDWTSSVTHSPQISTRRRSTHDSDNTQTDDLLNMKFQLSFLTPLLPSYFGSEWSFASFKVIAPEVLDRFGTTNGGSSMALSASFIITSKSQEKVMVTCGDGRVWRVVFDRKRRGEAVLDGVWRLDWPILSAPTVPMTHSNALDSDESPRTNLTTLLPPVMEKI